MAIRLTRKAVYGFSLALAGLGTAGAFSLPSIRSLLATQREVIVQALEEAIARGDNGPAPLPGVFIADDEETVADDALVRALWQRLENGPISQDSILNLLRET